MVRTRLFGLVCGFVAFLALGAQAKSSDFTSISALNKEIVANKFAAWLFTDEDTKTPEAKPRFGVLGQVQKPAYYPLSKKKPITAREALRLAGGPTESGFLRKAVILRMNKGRATALPVDLETILKQSKNDKSPILQDGDVLFVPTLSSQRKFAVLGQVEKPDYYPLSEKEPLTVVEALAFAGGPTEFGFTRKAVLLRQVNGKQTVIPIDFDAILKKGILNKTILIQDGDVLFLPSRVRRNIDMSHDLGNPMLGDFPSLDGWRLQFIH